MRAMSRAWAVAAFLLAAFALKGLLLVPPTPDPSSAFNTDRAAARLERILGDQHPHPVDTAANDLVRQRILAELASLGLQGEVREEPNCNGLPGFRMVSCSLTRNIVAVIGGSQPGKALLLNAHYDSTPTGPGAADDGIGVATLLEVAADLQSRPPANPVILLFNEGEEFGLNGAAAFARSDPLAARVGSLINVEARGVDGPAWMFETSEPNHAPIAAFAASSARPYANSLTADAAKLIPNYTDVAVFKEAPRTRGWRTLSFAVTGNEARYHTPGDRVEWLDRSSLFHMGSQVLGAARALPAARDGGERVYADIAGRGFIALPFVVAEVILGLLLGGAIYLGWRERAFARPLLATSATLVAGVTAAAALDWLGTMVRPGDYWRAYPLVPYLASYAAALAAMAAALGWLARGVDRQRLRIACWLLILALGALMSVFVHGAIIFFVIAPVLAIAGLAIPPARTPLLWAAALIQLVMLGQLMASVEQLLIDGPLWATAPLAAIAALPFLVEIAGAPLGRPAVALAAIGIGLWAAALVMPRSSAERPAAFTIDYVRDDATGNASWSIRNKQAPLPGSFDQTGTWTRGLLPFSGQSRWLAQAPLIDIPQASAAKSAESVVDGKRVVRFRLATGGADMVMLRFADDVPVLALGLAGQAVAIPATKGEPALIRCSGRACDGIELEAVLGIAAPVEAMVIATSFRLPPQGKRLAALRPADAHPQYGPDSSLRITRSSL